MPAQTETLGFGWEHSIDSPLQARAKPATLKAESPSLLLRRACWGKQERTRSSSLLSSSLWLLLVAGIPLSSNLRLESKQCWMGQRIPRRMWGLPSLAPRFALFAPSVSASPERSHLRARGSGPSRKFEVFGSSGAMLPSRGRPAGWPGRRRSAHSASSWGRACAAALWDTEKLRCTLPHNPPLLLQPSLVHRSACPLSGPSQTVFS